MIGDADRANVVFVVVRDPLVVLGVPRDDLERRRGRVEGTHTRRSCGDGHSSSSSARGKRRAGAEPQSTGARHRREGGGRGSAHAERSAGKEGAGSHGEVVGVGVGRCGPSCPIRRVGRRASAGR